MTEGLTHAPEQSRAFRVHRITSWACASAAMLICTTLLAGCDLAGPAPATTAPTASPAPGLNGGYLSATTTDAQYLELTENGIAITGSFERTFEGLTPQPPTAQSQNLSVNGTQAGSQLSLTLSDGSAVSGTVASDGSLNLAFPQPNGVLQSVAFAPATTDAYNAAEAAVQDHARMEDTVSYWSSQAQTSGACAIGVSGTYTTITVLGSDALSTCESAIRAGYVSATSVDSSQRRSSVCTPSIRLVLV